MDVLVKYSYTCQHDEPLFRLSVFRALLPRSLSAYEISFSSPFSVSSPLRSLLRLLIDFMFLPPISRWLPPRTHDRRVLGEADDKNRIDGRAPFCRCVERLALATSSPSALFKNAARLCQFLRWIRPRSFAPIIGLGTAVYTHHSRTLCFASLLFPRKTYKTGRSRDFSTQYFVCSILYYFKYFLTYKSNSL